mgnify:CR=1 FL=1
MQDTQIKIEVGTDCICVYCSTCGIGFIEAPNCEECGAETTYAGECFDCQPWDWAQEEVEKWIAATNSEYLTIEGKAMGWQRRSGYADIQADWPDIKGALCIAGDFRLVFTIDGVEPIKVVRYSHDEPTGASFTITKREGEE